MSNGECSTESRQGILAMVVASSLQSLIVNAGSCLSKEEAGKLVLEVLLDVHQPTVGMLVFFSFLFTPGNETENSCKELKLLLNNLFQQDTEFLAHDNYLLIL